uniref:Protein transport protein SEC20 n=1 Tax=Tetraselmis sp. GSL018 TaxID=582737 RepID=A0A061QWH4_9CHLO|mmetsp:Transcript_35312/g.83764  ORF Transcript_35312/g.83764 Transcript_35312/m.83764 type:complete len:1417 (+) Transcript_35312:257-4507(+)|eukprot:CAMPEP_0177614558 /NCGR_PEP_ID=MMETSP0419_2-20121207/22788_1 /TAXON_ID=582737 /ORGANISM="Tetraselmis sp., Strain GSL018" /LENGTH=1416 /DNA_ID=CAMNT_0019111761 /DNA_START=180 /DNA_END=4430 /DNA_ORIENTATION=+
MDEDERIIESNLVELAARVRKELDNLVEGAKDSGKSLGTDGTIWLSKASSRVKDSFSGMRQQLRDLELLADEQETPEEMQRVMERLNVYKREHERLQQEFQAAHAEARRQAAKAARDERTALLSGAGSRQVAAKLETEAEKAKAAEDITASLRRTRQRMAEEIEQSAASLETLKESDAQLLKTSDEYKSQVGLFGASRRLLRSMQVQDLVDRVILWGGLALFLLVAAYVVSKRVGYFTPAFLNPMSYVGKQPSGSPLPPPAPNVVPANAPHPPEGSPGSSPRPGTDGAPPRRPEPLPQGTGAISDHPLQPAELDGERAEGTVPKRPQGDGSRKAQRGAPEEAQEQDLREGQALSPRGEPDAEPARGAEMWPLAAEGPPLRGSESEAEMLAVPAPHPEPVPEPMLEAEESEDDAVYGEEVPQPLGGPETELADALGERPEMGAEGGPEAAETADRSDGVVGATSGEPLGGPGTGPSSGLPPDGMAAGTGDSGAPPTEGTEAAAVPETRMERELSGGPAAAATSGLAGGPGTTEEAVLESEAPGEGAGEARGAGSPLLAEWGAAPVAAGGSKAWGQSAAPELPAAARGVGPDTAEEEVSAGPAASAAACPADWAEPGAGQCSAEEFAEEEAEGEERSRSARKASASPDAEGSVPAEPMKEGLPPPLKPGGTSLPRIPQRAEGEYQEERSGEADSAGGPDGMAPVPGTAGDQGSTEPPAAVRLVRHRDDKGERRRQRLEERMKRKSPSKTGGGDGDDDTHVGAEAATPEFGIPSGRAERSGAETEASPKTELGHGVGANERRGRDGAHLSGSSSTGSSQPGEAAEGREEASLPSPSSGDDSGGTLRRGEATGEDGPGGLGEEDEVDKERRLEERARRLSEKKRARGRTEIVAVPRAEEEAQEGTSAGRRGGEPASWVSSAVAEAQGQAEAKELAGGARAQRGGSGNGSDPKKKGGTAPDSRRPGLSIEARLGANSRPRPQGAKQRKNFRNSTLGSRSRGLKGNGIEATGAQDLGLGRQARASEGEGSIQHQQRGGSGGKLNPRMVPVAGRVGERGQAVVAEDLGQEPEAEPGVGGLGGGQRHALQDGDTGAEGEDGLEATGPEEGVSQRSYHYNHGDESGYKEEDEGGFDEEDALEKERRLEERALHSAERSADPGYEDEGSGEGDFGEEEDEEEKERRLEERARIQPKPPSRASPNEDEEAEDEGSDEGDEGMGAYESGGSAAERTQEELRMERMRRNDIEWERRLSEIAQRRARRQAAERDAAGEAGPKRTEDTGLAAGLARGPDSERGTSGAPRSPLDPSPGAGTPEDSAPPSQSTEAKISALFARRIVERAKEDRHASGGDDASTQTGSSGGAGDDTGAASGGPEPQEDAELPAGDLFAGSPYAEELELFDDDHSYDHFMDDDAHYYYEPQRDEL